jgi:hypothetical protein
MTCQNIRALSESLREPRFSPFPMEKSKIYLRLLSVLSLPRKFVYDHCCCPNSAIILTVLKMEATLEFGRGSQNLSYNPVGSMWVGGGVWRGNAAQASWLLSHLKGGVRRGGRGGRRLSLISRPCLPISPLLSSLLPLLFRFLLAGCEALSR